MDARLQKIISDVDATLSSEGYNFLQFFAAVGEKHTSMLNLSGENHKKFSSYYRSLQTNDYSVYSKGALLENLTAILFGEQVFTVLRNCHTSSNELDALVTWSEKSRSLNFNTSFPCFGDSFICECKNYNGPVNVTYVGKFYSLLRLSSAKLGIMVSWNGVTGRTDWSDAQGLIKKIALKESLFIIVLDRNDLKRVCDNETNIFSLVADKCFALQQDIDYSDCIKRHEAENILFSRTIS